MRSVLLRPRWIVAHITVLLIAVAFVSLGLWQLRRLDERRDNNAVVSARLSEAPRPLAEALEEFGNDPTAVPYRRVTVTGRYQAADEVLLTPRNRDGAPGHHVLTPLVVGDRTAVLVERGWVPFDSIPPVKNATPPGGDVEVTGYLLPTQEASRSGTLSGGDRIEFLSAGDVDAVQPQTDLTLLPVTVVLQSQAPSTATAPPPPQPLDLSEGPHLSYALQWFAFTLVGLVGYPLVIRRRLRQEPEGPGDPSSDRNPLNSATTSNATTP